MSRPTPLALRSRAFRSDRIAWVVTVLVLLAAGGGARAWLHRRVLTDGERAGPRTTGFRLAVLAYDRIGRGSDDGHLPVERLAEHLAALEEAGFQPVSLREVHDAFLGGAPLPARPVLLTFDGGHLSTYEAVDPLLRRLRWPAAMLLDPALQEQRHATYVYWDRLRRMVDSGVWDVGTLGRSREDAALVARRLGGHQVLAALGPPPGAGPSADARDQPPLVFERSLFGVNDASADPRRLSRLRVPREWSGRELVERVTFSLAAPVAATCRDPVPVPTSRWVAAAGALEREGDVVRLSGAPRGEAWLAGGEWADDFVLDLEVQASRGVFWIVQQAVGSREQWRWGGTERTLYLQRLRPGHPVEVVSRVDLPRGAGAWHAVRLVKRGDGVWVEWDGRRVGDMPRSVAAGWRGHVGVATGSAGEAGEVAFRDVRFAAIPYRVRAVSAAPRQDEVQALLRDAPCLAAISPPGLVERGAALAPRPANRRLLSMLAAHGAWDVLPSVELSPEWLAEGERRAAEVAELAVREGWSGIRLVPPAGPDPGADAWRASVGPWTRAFASRGLRLVLDAEPSGEALR